MKLKEDVRGLMDGALYGSMGDEVKVIVVNGNVSIVEGAKGNRFPVKNELLTEEKIEKPELPAETQKEDKPIINQAPAGKKSKGRQAPTNQPDLFL